MASSGDDRESDNPPWYAYRPDGRPSGGGVPDRLFRHPVIQQRKIHLSHAVKRVRRSRTIRVSNQGIECYNPRGIVFFTLVAPAPALLGNQVVKILNTDTQEMRIYERLLPDLHRPNNHTVPGEITRTGHPLLIMPRLHDINSLHIHDGWTLQRVMDAMLQFVEVRGTTPHLSLGLLLTRDNIQGIEYLHSKQIAHIVRFISESIF